MSVGLWCKDSSFISVQLHSVFVINCQRLPHSLPFSFISQLQSFITGCSFGIDFRVLSLSTFNSITNRNERIHEILPIYLKMQIKALQFILLASLATASAIPGNANVKRDYGYGSSEDSTSAPSASEPTTSAVADAQSAADPYDSSSDLPVSASAVPNAGSYGAPAEASSSAVTDAQAADPTSSVAAVGYGSGYGSTWPSNVAVAAQAADPSSSTPSYGGYGSVWPSSAIADPQLASSSSVAWPSASAGYGAWPSASPSSTADSISAAGNYSSNATTSSSASPAPTILTTLSESVESNVLTYAFGTGSAAAEWTTTVLVTHTNTLTETLTATFSSTEAAAQTAAPGYGSGDDSSAAAGDYSTTTIATTETHTITMHRSTAAAAVATGDSTDAATDANSACSATRATTTETVTSTIYLVRFSCTSCSNTGANYIRLPSQPLMPLLLLHGPFPVPQLPPKAQASPP